MHCYKPGPTRQETSFLQGASKISYILGYKGKNIRLRVSYKWFLKCGALLCKNKISPGMDVQYQGFNGIAEIADEVLNLQGKV